MSCAIAAPSATPIAPTITTASSEATACSGSGRMRAWEASPRSDRTRAGQRRPAHLSRPLGKVGHRACLARDAWAAQFIACRRSVKSSAGVWLAKRLWRPRPQQHSDGGRTRCARHRRWRSRHGACSRPMSWYGPEVCLAGCAGAGHLLGRATGGAHRAGSLPAIVRFPALAEDRASLPRMQAPD